jgi:hypothetical protein
MVDLDDLPAREDGLQIFDAEQAFKKTPFVAVGFALQKMQVGNRGGEDLEATAHALCSEVT